MTSRTYLSIGDVLTLLREEFPDVTISKIRFLESQGLVNPERSPSGYRKFFDHDVERLRWVLRQQREHFLPLKVIRDRLADGDLGDDAGTERPNGKAAEPVHAAAVAGVASGHAQEQPTKADEEAMARILADASRRAARLPEQPAERRGLQVVAETDVALRSPAEPLGPRTDVTAERIRRTPAERRDAAMATSTRPAAPTAAGAGHSGHGNGTGIGTSTDTDTTLPRQADTDVKQKPVTTPADEGAGKSAEPIAEPTKTSDAESCCGGDRRKPVGRGTLRGQRPVTSGGGRSQGIRPRGVRQRGGHRDL